MKFEDGFDVKKAKDISYINGWIEWIRNGDSIRNFIEEDCEPDDPYNVDKNGFNVIKVFSEGGHTGDGDYCCAVYAIVKGRPEITDYAEGSVAKDAVAYVSYQGFHSSYAATEWADECKLVFPKVVEVVHYLSIPE